MRVRIKNFLIRTSVIFLLFGNLMAAAIEEAPPAKKMCMYHDEIDYLLNLSDEDLESALILANVDDSVTPAVEVIQTSDDHTSNEHASTSHASITEVQKLIASPDNNQSRECEAQSDLFFILPRHQDGYTRSLYYMDDNFNVTAIYLKGEDISKMEYSVVQRSYPLHELSSTAQRIQSWKITYSPRHSWELELWGTHNSLIFIDTKQEIFGGLFIDKDGKLVYKKNDHPEKVVAEGMSYVRYAPSLYGHLLFLGSSSISVSCGVRDDSVTLSIDGKKWDHFRVEFAENMDGYTMAGFLRDVMPSLQGLDCYPTLRKDRSTVATDYGESARKLIWLVGHTAKGGHIQYFTSAKNREEGEECATVKVRKKGKICPQEEYGGKGCGDRRLYCWNFNRALKKNCDTHLQSKRHDVFLGFCKQGEEQEKGQVLFFREGAQRFPWVCPTTLSDVVVACPHYRENSIELVFLTSHSGYLRLYASETNPLQVEIEAIQYSFLDKKKRLVAIQGNKIDPLWSTLPYRQDNSPPVRLAKKEDNYVQSSVVESPSLKLVRGADDSLLKVNVELTAHLIDERNVGFYFSINGTHLQLFYINYDSDTLYLLKGTQPLERAVLRRHMKGQVKLSVSSVEAQKLCEKHKIVVCADGMPAASVQLFYKSDPSSDELYRGYVGWQVLSYKQYGLVDREEDFLSSAFDLSKMAVT